MCGYYLRAASIRINTVFLLWKYFGKNFANAVKVYRMVGNFRGLLIFVVDLAFTKFSHPRKLIPTVICKSMMMGVATNIVAARPTLPSINKQ